MTPSVPASPLSAAPPVTGGSTVRVHPVSMREDGDSWVIGRADTGEFILVPDVAHQILLLLAAQRTVTEVQRTVRSDDGEEIDVGDFVSDLAALGFIDAIDGRALVQPQPPRPSLPWLTAAQTRWLLHPAAAMAAAAIIAAGIGCLIARPALAPGYHSLIWSRWGGLVLLADAAIAWTLIFLHELAHLATARGAGVPARISLGTRLQFLVAQTDVTGVWARPRRTRLTVYLAGIGFDLLVAALGVIVLAIAGTALPATADRLISATVLLSVLYLPVELCVFMRTDVYFVLADLTGCASLYADGTAFLRYQVRRVGYQVRRGARVVTDGRGRGAARRGVLDRERGGPAGTGLADPSLGLPARERRAVRVYGVVLVAGSAICLAVAVTAELPAVVLLLVRAVGDLVGTATPARLLNGAAVLIVTGGTQVLWARAWWRRHGERLRRVRRARRPSPPASTGKEVSQP